MPVKDDQVACIDLWKNYSVRVMPGSYMAKEINGFNPGKGFLRIALVDKSKVVERAMKRFTKYLNKI